jgi:hypothetical protein
MFLELGALLLFKYRFPRSDQTSLPRAEFHVNRLQHVSLFTEITVLRDNNWKQLVPTLLP